MLENSSMIETIQFCAMIKMLNEKKARHLLFIKLTPQFPSLEKWNVKLCKENQKIVQSIPKKTNVFAYVRVTVEELKLASLE